MPSSSLLANRSFLGLATAQFLGAVNDNFYKMVVSLFAVEAAANASGSSYVELTGALFALPYLLFSAYAGHLADVLSKRFVLIACKVFEIGIMAAALVVMTQGIWIGGLLFILFLMATHSAFFSPSKYGSVPEIVASHQLTQANGIMEAAHHSAIILGTAIAGPLMQAWADTPSRLGIAAMAIATIGLICTLMVKPVPAACPHRPWPKFPWSGFIEGVKRISKSRSLSIAVLSLAFFDGIAMMTMLDMIFIVKIELGMDETAASEITTFAAVGTIVGALACSYFCRFKIWLGITPLAGCGVAAGLVALAFAPDSGWTLKGLPFPLPFEIDAYRVMGGFLFALGVFAGLFIVPFYAWLQKTAKRDEKGLIISTANFIDMAGLVVFSVGLLALHNVMGLDPRAILLAAAMITGLYVVGVFAIWKRLKTHVVLFVLSIYPQTEP